MTNVREPQKLCFVLTPLGAEWRDYADQVVEFIVAEAIEALGYRLVRAERVSESGAIAAQVIQHLVQDSLVIADLTGQEAQVLYGLAIRHATQRPVIHLVKDDAQTLFEKSDVTLIRVNVESAREARRSKRDLSSALEKLEQGLYPQDTPISQALKEQVLTQSESILDQRAAAMIKLLDAIQGGIMGINERIAQPENILPSEHLVNTLKTSGVLLNRDEIDRSMSEIFNLAEEAKHSVEQTLPDLSTLSKGLYSLSSSMSTAQTQTTPVDLTQLAGQVDQFAASAVQHQGGLDEVSQKLNSMLSTLSQLYRNLSKLTL